VSTDDDTTAAMVTDLATATELIYAVARDTHAPAARCAEAADHLHQVNQHLNAANEEAGGSMPPSATWASSTPWGDCRE